MAQIPNDGSVLVIFVPGETAVADIESPTTVELATGVKIQGNITPDGLDISMSQDSVDVSTLESTFNTTAPGRKGGTCTLTYFEDSDTEKDLAHTALVENQLGFLYVRQDGSKADVAVADGQSFQGYPVQCGAQQPVKVAKNTRKQWTSVLSFIDDWTVDAVVGGAS